LKQPLILSNKEDIQDIDNIITTFLRKGSKWKRKRHQKQ
jgi:hypothetical protein